MDDQGNVYLCDFSVSAFVYKGQKRNTFVGSPCWMAPEIMEQGDGYDIKADIWSLGILCYEFLFGNPPFEEISSSDTYMRIIKAEFT